MQEDPVTFKSGEPTPDGSNSSDTRVEILSMSKERLLMFLEAMTEKIRMFSFGRDTTDATNNGISSTVIP